MLVLHPDLQNMKVAVSGPKQNATFARNDFLGGLTREQLYENIKATRLLE